MLYLSNAPLSTAPLKQAAHRIDWILYHLPPGKLIVLFQYDLNVSGFVQI